MDEHIIKTDQGNIKLPCMNPIIVKISQLQANDYNPNNVSENNMKLLEESIISNGFCYPVVTIYDSIKDKYIIIDGFHRYTIFKDYLKAKEIPIIILNQNISERMEATVQFNRARGVHQTELMGNLVVELLKNGVDETAIAKKLGMELEEVLRLKQVKGVANFFKNEEYSNAWKII